MRDERGVHSLDDFVRIRRRSESVLEARICCFNHYAPILLTFLIAFAVEVLRCRSSVQRIEVWYHHGWGTKLDQMLHLWY